MAWTASWTATWTMARSRAGTGLGRGGVALTTACTAMLFQTVAASGSALAERLMMPVTAAARVLGAELMTAEVKRSTTTRAPKGRQVFLYASNIVSPLFWSRGS